MIKKSWQQILSEADEFIKFLHRDAFFDTPYQENLKNEFVTTDAVLVRHFSEDDSFDDFDEWETVTDSDKVFPDSFEFYRVIDYQLSKNKGLRKQTPSERIVSEQL